MKGPRMTRAGAARAMTAIAEEFMREHPGMEVIVVREGAPSPPGAKRLPAVARDDRQPVRDVRKLRPADRRRDDDPRDENLNDATLRCEG